MSMKRLLIAILCTALLVSGVLYNLWQDGSKPNYGAIPYFGFWALVVIGTLLRVRRARRDSRAPRPFQPLADASKVYENILLSRPDLDAQTDHEADSKDK